MNKKKKNVKSPSLPIIILLSVCFVMACFLSMPRKQAAASESLSREVLRFHVLANSDSKEDQDLKLQVKAAVLTAIEPLLSSVHTKDEVIRCIEQNEEIIRNTALTVIHEQGYDYPVDITIENQYFPLKTYGDLTFPCGYYDACCIRIGNAKGKNWWCVLYPQLCFVDMTYGIVPEQSKEELRLLIGDENYECLIHDMQKDSEIEVKFYVIEMFRQLFG